MAPKEEPPPESFKKIITIDVYEDHALFIKDIQKLAKLYACGYCQTHFTRLGSLHRHRKTCSNGQTKIICPNEQVYLPLTDYEKSFYSKGTFSTSSIRLLEQTSKALGVHIHHALCGHGGERWIKGAFVDGYEPKSKTVFQFHGCHFHGCEKCFPNGRQKVVTNGKTRDEARTPNAKRTQALREAGFQVIEKWECQSQKTREPLPEKRMRPYPHAIFYDFEAYQDKSQHQQPTADLIYENVHVPISVDTWETH